jgi:hypothetical protein
MDATNPGQVEVEDQSVGNPQLTVDSQAQPNNEAELLPVSDEGFPKASNDVEASTFPTPANVVINDSPLLPQNFGQAVPPTTNVDVAAQSLGLGTFVDGVFVSPSDFIVPTTGNNVQTNTNDDSEISLKITLVLDPATGLPPAIPDPAISGSFGAVVSNGAGGVICYAPSNLPPLLNTGTVIQLSNSTVPSYNATMPVIHIDTRVASFASVSSGGTGKSILNFASALPPVFVNGALVVVSPDSGTAYSGTFIIADVTSNSFSIPVTFTTTMTGNARANAFELGLPFAGTASGLWASRPAATRYQLFVTDEDGSPADLGQLPVTITGREMVFADDTTTTALQGDSRPIAFCGNNYVIVDRTDPVTQATLPMPAVGDVFEVDTCREGAQAIRDGSANILNVVVFPAPPAFVPNPDQALKSLGNVLVPGDVQPVITSGQAAPSAITVEVANQCQVIGYPINSNP